MKFKMMRGLLVVAAMIPAMMLAACGKKDEGGSVAVTPAAGYYTANNQCYQSGTTTVVSMTLCNQGTGYYQSGNVCYQNGTNTVVSLSLCQNQGQYPVGGNYPVTQVPNGYVPGIGGAIGGNIGMIGQYQYCIGYFFSPYYGWGICNGTNCHNVMLYNQYGQPVYCP